MPPSLLLLLHCQTNIKGESKLESESSGGRKYAALFIYALHGLANNAAAVVAKVLG